ncbi:hypothetical protein BOTCAL_0056g00300 [Botryotinia calthae]|uniref:Uncharacterized protein n=1 Tax=Botryotinia calthae TaxID=38488 RepID=A0A4Y8DCQ1_9HELO|nr:hypothetical protein BOTCAL_0056g00300 [Botryotinia calthae]
MNASQVSTSILDLPNPTKLQFVRVTFFATYGHSLRICLYLEVFALKAAVSGVPKKPVSLRERIAVKSPLSDWSWLTTPSSTSPTQFRTNPSSRPGLGAAAL